MPLMRVLADMSYLWRVPHALDGAKLRAVVGELPGTPVDEALLQSLRAVVGVAGTAVAAQAGAGASAGA
jgi:ribosomal protein L12E/L44/L45/RPP1/RPP2